jgi:WD40 repeat protein
MDAHLKEWQLGTYTQKNDIVAHLYTLNYIDFSSDMRYFATASKDKTIKIWEAETRKLLKVIDRGRHNAHQNSVNKVLWLPNSHQLISCSDDRTLIYWDLTL